MHTSVVLYGFIASRIHQISISLAPFSCSLNPFSVHVLAPICLIRIKLAKWRFAFLRHKAQTF